MIPVLVERRGARFLAYPAGLAALVEGRGGSREEALRDLRAAVQFHIATFGPCAFAQAPDDVTVVGVELGS